MGITTQSFGGFTKAAHDVASYHTTAMISDNAITAAKIAAFGLMIDETTTWGGGTGAADYVLQATKTVAGVAGKIWMFMSSYWTQFKNTSLNAADGYKLTAQVEGGAETVIDEFVGALSALGAYCARYILCPIKVPAGAGITLRCYAKSGDTKIAVAGWSADARSNVILSQF
jgi:hypothetical protein